jgi:hypothetical protein
MFIQIIFIILDSIAYRPVAELFSPAIFAFSLSELPVSLDSTKLHSEVLFLDRT